MRQSLHGAVMNTAQSNAAADDSNKLDAFRQALQQARDTIAALVAENAALKQTPAAAVVGMACRFPGGADDLQRFWDLLTEQRDAISEVDHQRWPADAYFSDDRDAPGKMYTCKAGFLEGDITTFDAAFFGISPKEATALDPQQRLLLEVTWHALEDAGIVPSSLKGSRTGVFVGMSGDDYARLHRHSGSLQTIDAYSITGTTMSTAAGRIAYTFGLHGPCLTLDTACSSSLVALHLALQSLRRGECDTAIVAGVNLILMPELHVAFSKLQALSPDGACRTFDASANGYVRSEGCAALVLKRQETASADNDDIAALIKGCAVNQDGKTAGLAAPNGGAQRLAIRAALEDAVVSANDIDYVEAHGTGTNLGDPIELEALGRAMADDRNRPLLVGSVKSNIGHMEPVAGLGGLIKIALSLRHQLLPANLHFNTPNPHIDWAQLPVTVVDKPMAWPASGKPRVAGLSSFGFSGTNAHVIIADAPVKAPHEASLERDTTDAKIPERGIHALALSARTNQSLRGLVHAYAEHLEQGSPALADVCFWANTRRETFDQQLVLTAKTAQEMAQGLRATLQTSTTAQSIGWSRDNATSLTWLFTGQGAQYAGMGATLYRTAPVFRQAIDDCAAVLDGHLDRPLTELLFEPDPNDAINQTRNTQPTLFALQYALAQLWLSWGIKPTAVIGHSVGEFAAACVAGVFSLTDALKLVTARGELMQALPAEGAMAAVFTAADVVEQTIDSLNLLEQVNIACLNHPGETVVSGETAGVDALLQALACEGIVGKRLTVSHAFHSNLMTPMLGAFARVADSITLSRPIIPLISNLTGKPAGDEILSAQYWCDHVRDPVRFHDSVQYLLAADQTTFLEMGPQPVLCAHVKASASTDTARATIGTLRKGRDDWAMLGQAVIALAQAGVQIDWSGWDRPYQRQPVKVPHYVFDRQRFWQDQGHRAALGRTDTATQTQALALHVAWEDATNLISDNQSTAAQPGKWLLLGQETATMTQALTAALQAANQPVCALAPLSDCSNDGAANPALLKQVLDPDLTGIVIIPGDPSAVELPNELHALTALLAQLTQRPSPVPVWVIGQRWGSVNLPAYRGALKSIRLNKGGNTTGGVIECRSDSMGPVVKILLSDTTEDWWCVEQQGDGKPHTAQHRVSVARLKPLPPNQTRSSLARQASYLVSGGLGGLGLALAAALAEFGVAQVILLGRRPADDHQRAAIDAIERRGTLVKTLACDLGEPNASAMVGAFIADLEPPLKGVFHLAGVMGAVEPTSNSGAVATHDFSLTLAGKLDGAWALHQATADCDLDHFVLFGSISALTGTPGMAAYTAANAGLEQVVHVRHQRHLPALCVHWGPWQGGAMITDARRNQTEQSGFRLLSNEAGFAQLWDLLHTDISQAAVVDANWDRVNSVFGARCVQPLLSSLAEPSTSVTADTATSAVSRGNEPALVQTLLPLGREQQAHTLGRALQSELASVLSLPPARAPDPSQGFFDMGMDSLTAFEFREAIQRLTGLSIGTPIVFDYPSIDAMTAYLLDQLQPLVATAPTRPSVARQAPLTDSSAMQSVDVSTLSDDDIARLLEQEFNPSDGAGDRS